MSGRHPARSGLSPARTALYASGNLGAGLVFAFMNGALPLYLATYGLPNALIGFLSQDRPPLAGLAQIVVGAISDRTRTPLGRRRPFILVGVPVAALALIVLATHPPVWLVVGLLVLMTTALAVSGGPYLALLADLVPSQQRGRVNAALTIASMTGQVTILALAATLWERSEPLVFVIVAAGLVLFSAIVVLFIHEPREAPLSRSPTHPVRWLRDLAGQRQLVAYLFATFFFWLAAGGVAPFLTRFGVEELGTAEGQALGLLIVALVSTAVFTLPAGWLADRYGKKPVMLAGLVLFGATAIAGSQVRTVEQAVVALAVVGAGNALSTVPLFPLLTDLIARERTGELTGVGGAVWELGQPLGAILAGLGADVTGSLRAPLVVAGVSCLVAAALLTRVRAPRSETGMQAAS